MQAQQATTGTGQQAKNHTGQQAQQAQAACSTAVRQEALYAPPQRFISRDSSEKSRAEIGRFLHGKQGCCCGQRWGLIKEPTFNST
eukprot:6196292-Pleurochrysis_carterae.AAC.1